MRIAFIGQKRIPATSGGVEKNVENLATRLAEMGHDVFAYAFEKNNQKLPKEYRGIKLINSSNVLTATFHALFSNYDIIHYQLPQSAISCFFLKFLKRRTAIVITLHSRNNSSFAEKTACKFSDKIIVTSKNLRNYIFNKYKAKAAYVPNGSQVIYNNEIRALDRWKLKKGKYILSIAKKTKSKGIEYLIESFKNIEATNKMPNGFKLIIILDGFQKKDYLKELYILRGAKNNIIFTENQTGATLEQLFSHAYLFVQPSESEGLSISLLEAMGYGIAPLVSNIPENLEAIGKCGFSFHTRSKESLEEKLAYLLNKSDEVEKMGKCAKERVRKEYSWETIARKTLRIYELNQKLPRKLTFSKISAESKSYV
jgi:glycosyltransferase involved in cell wall biosynthesis